MSNALILSWNPVPTVRGKDIISATGMRCQKLAEGLTQNGISAVDIAVRDYDKSSGRNVNKDIGIIAWKTDAQIAKIAANYDSVILNPGYGESAEYILSELPPQTLKITDLFIPFYFDNAFTHSTDNNYDNKIHTKSMNILNNCLVSSDYLLVASEAQKNMYLGAMGALDMINYKNFHDYNDNLIVTPPGILNEHINEDNPYDQYLDVIAGRKIIVWYGSLYKWYDAKPILKAFSDNNDITKEYVLFVLGATNPEFDSEENAYHDEKTSNNVVWIPWVKYSERLNWLKHADAGTTYNKLTVENRFSFRNRLLDYIEARLPFITNGQDPLGEKAIDAGFAKKIENPISLGDLDDAVSLKKNFTDSNLKPFNNTECHKQFSELVFKKNKSKLNQDYLDVPTGLYKSLTAELNDAQNKNSALKNDNEAKQQTINELKMNLKKAQEEYDKLPKTTRQFIKRSIKTRIKE